MGIILHITPQDDVSLFASDDSGQLDQQSRRKCQTYDLTDVCQCQSVVDVKQSMECRHKQYQHQQQCAYEESTYAVRIGRQTEDGTGTAAVEPVEQTCHTKCCESHGTSHAVVDLHTQIESNHGCPLQ